MSKTGPYAAHCCSLARCLTIAAWQETCSPTAAIKPVVLVEDNEPIHVSKLTLKAIEARKHWLTVEWLAEYAPELNDIEVVWHDLKARHLAHQTFADADALDRAIHAAVAALNRSELNPLVIQRISA